MVWNGRNLWQCNAWVLGWGCHYLNALFLNLGLAKFGKSKVSLLRHSSFDPSHISIDMKPIVYLRETPSNKNITVNVSSDGAYCKLREILPTDFRSKSHWVHQCLESWRFDSRKRTDKVSHRYVAVACGDTGSSYSFYRWKKLVADAKNRTNLEKWRQSSRC